MKNLKKILPWCLLFFCTIMQADERCQNLEQKIQQLENVIANMIKNETTKSGYIDEKENKPENDHRMTLRIPKWLLAKIDTQRKKRVGKISRNLWILEVILRATKK